MLSRAQFASVASVTVVTGACAIAATALFWLVQEDWPGLGVALVSLLLMALPAPLVRDEPLRHALSIAGAILLSAHVVLGMQLGLYESSRLYDKAMHLLGSAAIAGVLAVAAQSYCRGLGMQLPVPLVRVLVFAGTLGAGALWEIFEFSVDQTGLFVAQRGLQDTMLDLIANTAGGVLALFLLPGSAPQDPTLAAPAGLLPSDTAPISHSRGPG